MNPAELNNRLDEIERQIQKQHERDEPDKERLLRLYSEKINCLALLLAHTQAHVTIDITLTQEGLEVDESTIPENVTLRIRDYEVPDDWEGEVKSDDDGNTYEEVIITKEGRQ